MNKLFFQTYFILLLISCVSTSVSKEEAKLQEKSFYDFSINKPDGSPVSMEKYKGNVVLIVNTATKCGLTPQFEGLQKLHEKYESKGLQILGIPCNQFMGQEPNSNDEMEAVCKKDHGVTFQLFEKSNVNGDDAIDLYKFLRVYNVAEHGNKIRWNFEKFLVDKKGVIVNRFKPTTKPEEIEGEIQKLLSL